MPWWTFSQNNSGGRFKGPAMYVIVEARDKDEANDRARDNGLYFDGCAEGRDCSCCGDRWHEAWEEGGDLVPSIYGIPVEKVVPSDLSICWAKEEKIPYALVLPLDGPKGLLPAATKE